MRSANPLGGTDTDVITLTPSKGKTYEERIISMGSLVHRWKFSDGSGDFNDSVGGLTLTKSGTITYGVTGPVGGAITFGASGKGVTSGMGNIPVGATARTFLLVFKAGSSTGKQTCYSYGTSGSTRQWWSLFLDEPTNTQSTLALWADDVSTGTGLNYFGNDQTKYHLFAATYDGNLTACLFQDGGYSEKTLAGVLNTGSAGNFQIGLDTTSANQLGSCSFDDLAIFKRRLSFKELIILYRCLQRASGT